MVRVAALAQLPPDSTVEVTVGEKIIAVCNSGGEITALDGVCPHQDGPLGHGAVSDGYLVCPWHLWEFNCRSGAFRRNPSFQLARYPVEVRDGDIFIALPDGHA